MTAIGKRFFATVAVPALPCTYPVPATLPALVGPMHVRPTAKGALGVWVGETIVGVMVPTGYIGRAVTLDP